MQREVHSINLRVEHNQLDLLECLKYHHPSSSDDEDDVPMAEVARSLCCVFFVFFFLRQFILDNLLNMFNSWIFLLCLP
jgi:hypothetical protein